MDFTLFAAAQKLEFHVTLSNLSAFNHSVFILDYRSLEGR